MPALTSASVNAWAAQYRKAVKQATEVAKNAMADYLERLAGAGNSFRPVKPGSNRPPAIGAGGPLFKSEPLLASVKLGEPQKVLEAQPLIQSAIPKRGQWRPTAEQWNAARRVFAETFKKELLER